MQFTFQILLLSIGFSVGYWLIITANKQEENLKNLGKILGLGLIVISILLAIFSFIYSMKIANSVCPVQKLMQPQGSTTINNEQENENEDLHNPTREQEENGELQKKDNIPTKNDNRPIKSNIKDHE